MLSIRSKGQSTLEYVILLGFVVAALIAMGAYMRRGTEGKLRESVDQIGEQYEAGHTTGSYTVTTNLRQHESLETDGHITTLILQNEQRRTGGEVVEAMPDVPTPAPQ